MKTNRMGEICKRERSHREVGSRQICVLEVQFAAVLPISLIFPQFNVLPKGVLEQIKKLFVLVAHFKSTNQCVYVIENKRENRYTLKIRSGN